MNLPLRANGNQITLPTNQSHRYHSKQEVQSDLSIHRFDAAQGPLVRLWFHRMPKVNLTFTTLAGHHFLCLRLLNVIDPTLGWRQYLITALPSLSKQPGVSGTYLWCLNAAFLLRSEEVSKFLLVKPKTRLWLEAYQDGKILSTRHRRTGGRLWWQFVEFPVFSKDTGFN